VLLVETRGAVVSVINAMTSRKGWVVRQRGGRYLSVFSGVEVDDPDQTERQRYVHFVAPDGELYELVQER